MTTITQAPKRVLTRKQRIDDILRKVDNDPDLHHLRLRNRIVTGYGETRPEVVFIKSCPTETDRLHGKAVYGIHPVYRDLMCSVGFSLSQAYFTHLVKFRPMNGREPRLSEIVTSTPYLVEELSILRPKVIVPMGANVTRVFLRDMKMAHARGATHEWNGMGLVPIFDPQIITIDPRNRPLVFGDFGLIRNII